ncbi:MULTISPECIES: TetR family transcriptional regulator [unclassified Micromonospora]|uniref:TetR family transcriptional regulator n=1 Tax=unclassified Micromonospora TaxID=2617518 RepID=UPI00331DCEFC
MTHPIGLRERKKQRTRAALITAAIELITTKGYDETTIAEIAAAADIAPRTFFAYFPGKEDVLFADSQARVDEIVAMVATRHPGETVADVLLRAVRSAVTSGAAARDLTSDLATRRVRVVLSTPALQAGALRRIVSAQQQLTAALLDAFPGELEEGDAAAAVGALVGSMVTVAFATLPHDPAPEELLRALLRATHVALAGIRSLGPAQE